VRPIRVMNSGRRLSQDARATVPARGGREDRFSG
jgi:hypothetical protein